MPKVHMVQKARKARPEHGIEVGDSYYWWKTRVGRGSGIKRYSKTPPTRSQLTNSGFLKELYSLQDSLHERLVSAGAGGFSDELQSVADEVRNMASECEEALENMPETLRETSSSGELLQERVDALNEWADELEGMVDLMEDDDNEDGEEEEERLEQAASEVENHTPDIS